MKRATHSAIAQAHERERGARLLAMCSGAFTLPETGLPAGRRATVPWQWADEFRSRRLQFIDRGGYSPKSICRPWR